MELNLHRLSSALVLNYKWSHFRLFLSISSCFCINLTAVLIILEDLVCFEIIVSDKETCIGTV